MRTDQIIAAQAAAFANTTRVLMGDWCAYCGHCNDDHSQILAGAPCLECECFGWTSPSTLPPNGHWAGPIFDQFTPEPVRRSWWRPPRRDRRRAGPIRNRAAPSTAELWRDGRPVS